MHGEFMQMRCDRFASELALKRSVPGGGAAAAYVGALGTALGQMVCNFTMGKARYADVEPDVRRICEDADAIRVRLLELADEDAEAFAPLADAYAIPKDDPTRDERLEAATIGAIRCPLEMMRLACDAIDLLSELQKKGSAMLISDVGCAAALCRASLEAGAMNVLVNTSSLQASDFAQSAERDCDEMLKKYVPLADEIVDAVMDSLRRD